MHIMWYAHIEVIYKATKMVYNFTRLPIRVHRHVGVMVWRGLCVGRVGILKWGPMRHIRHRNGGHGSLQRLRTILWKRVVIPRRQSHMVSGGSPDLAHLNIPDDEVSQRLLTETNLISFSNSPLPFRGPIYQIKSTKMMNQIKLLYFA